MPVQRYVAFLRAVGPMNASMPELKRCFESAGFSDVKTVRTSGNVVFSAGRAPIPSLEDKAEAAMKKRLGKPFFTIVRSVDHLQAILAADPFGGFRLPPGAKRVITFLKQPPQKKPRLPVKLDGARILSLEGSEVFTAYVPSPRGPAFMTLIQKTFGEAVTTRTWDTVVKVAT